MGDHNGPKWYFSRREIEENSPSRRDGIDLKKETRLRKSYCTFLQELGMQLKVPQLTIATAIVFCHRFYLYRSHGKNDTKIIATVCMFLAGKVEETPRPLKDFVLVSYGVVHRGDPAAVKKIKQKEVYEQQKELILLGERLVLTTLGFDLNVVHPYKPLIEAIKKFGITHDPLVQVAWNFVNDGLRTSLCLQFYPHHVAAGAIAVAARFLDVKMPTEGGRLWWQEFGVTPWQLEEISNQILDLYQRKSTGLEGITGGWANHLASTTSTVSEISIAEKFARGVGGDSVRSNDGRSSDAKSGVSDPITDIEGKDCLVRGAELVSCRRVSTAESFSCCSLASIEQPIGDAVVNVVGGTMEASGRLSDASGSDGETTAKDRCPSEGEWFHPSRESTGSGWPEHPERNHKRRRLERGG